MAETPRRINPNPTSKQLERWYQLLPDMVCTAGFDGYFRELNPAWERTLGYSREELCASPLFYFVHPDDRGATQRAVERLARGEEVNFFENRYRHRDGTWHRLEWMSYPVPEEQLIVACARDVTERWRAEERLRESEAMLALAQEVAHLGSWEISPVYFDRLDESPLRWSAQTYRIFGLDPAVDGISRRAFYRQVHKADRAMVARLFEATLETGAPYSVDHRIVLPDGAVRYVHSAARVLRHPLTGDPEKIAGTVQDITERKLAEERLRAQAEMLNQAYDAIVACTPEGRIVFWNRAAERLFGWTAEEALTMRKEQIFHDSAQRRQALEAVLTRGEWSGEMSERRRTGERLTLTSRWTVLRDEQGGIGAILVVSADVTEHKKLETQFLRAQRLESIGTLASGVAHDLNNILAPILLAVPVMRDESLTPDVQESLLRTIETSARHGVEIVRQVLTFAREEPGERVRLLPAQVLQEMALLVQETFPRSIRVAVSAGADAWALEADPNRLHQVLLNLCVNARDAMPEGGELTLSAQNLHIDAGFAARMPGARSGPHVMIQVRDSGHGIPPEVIDQIFDPFFTTKEPGKGTGLGLSTVVGVLKAHGGFVQVESEPGRGSTFRVYLPAVAAE